MKKQADYWDSVAENKKFTHPFCFDKFELIVPKTASILDYGCGYGRIMNELDKKGYRNLVGLDFSSQLVLRGQRLFPNLDINVNKDAIIPYPDKYFDAVILFAVLTCIAEDVKQKNLITEIQRILKPGSMIYISDYLIQNSTTNTERYKKFHKKYGCYGVFELSDGAILRHHTIEYMEQLTSQFVKIWDRNVEVTTMNGNRSTAFQYIGRTLN